MHTVPLIANVVRLDHVFHGVLYAGKFRNLMYH